MALVWVQQLVVVVILWVQLRAQPQELVLAREQVRALAQRLALGLELLALVSLVLQVVYLAWLPAVLEQVMARLWV